MSIHTDKNAPRYWATLEGADVPQPIAELDWVARRAAKSLGLEMHMLEFSTNNGVYRLHGNGRVERTRILPDCCTLPTTEAWQQGWSDEPHDGAPCKP